MSELVAAMKSLCRMCSSKGLIHINSVLEPSLLKMSRKVAEMWKVPILEMMTAIGGEEVTNIFNYWKYFFEKIQFFKIF